MPPVLSIPLVTDLQALIREARPERTLITTYAASLSYLESGLLSALTEHGRPRVRVLVDGTAFGDVCGEIGVRYAGVRYEVFPVRTIHAGYRFHPKTYALLADEKITVVVASANLTVPGFRRNWEVFDILTATRIHNIRRDRTEGDVAALTQYAAFLDRLAVRGTVLSPAAAAALHETADDIREFVGPPPHTDDGRNAGRGGPWLLHSVDAPILDQLLQLAPAADVVAVTAFSPYFDPGAEAVRRLARSYPRAARIRLVVDPTSKSMFNGRALRAHAKRLEVSCTHADAAADARFLHAKLLVLEDRLGAWIVSGSANLTFPGLCGAVAPAVGGATGNVEAVIVRYVPDLRRVRSLVGAVPVEPWENWAAGEVVEPIVDPEPPRGAPGIELLDAEVDGSLVRCVVRVTGIPPARLCATAFAIHLDCSSQRARLPVERVLSDENGTVTVLATLRDARLARSDEVTRVEIAVVLDAVGGVRAVGWLRRSDALRRSASTVSLHEFLRPMRISPRPNADVLVDLYAKLPALLAHLAEGRKSDWPNMPGALSTGEPFGNGTTPSDRSPRGDDHGARGALLDLADLLTDRPRERQMPRVSGRTADATDGIHAIVDALYAHVDPAYHTGNAPATEGRSARVARGAVPPNGSGAGGLVSSGTASSAELQSSQRHVPALSMSETAELAELADGLVGVLWSIPETLDGLDAVLTLAEPVGVVLLANAVVRARRPAGSDRNDDGRVASQVSQSRDGTPTTGSRSDLLTALVAWWRAILSAAPGADGEPKGWLPRAWASDVLRAPLLQRLAVHDQPNFGGLPGLTAGLSIARTLLRVDRGTDATLDDGVIGLAIIADWAGSVESARWGRAAIGRAAYATQWWPRTARDALNAVWRAPLTTDAPFFSAAKQWSGLLRTANGGDSACAMSSAPTGDPLQWTATQRSASRDAGASDIPEVLRRRVAQLKTRYRDPIATFDVEHRRTSCCPTSQTYAAFGSEVARAWPAMASCPQCGRIVAPPEAASPAMTRVMASWDRLLALRERPGRASGPSVLPLAASGEEEAGLAGTGE